MRTLFRFGAGASILFIKSHHAWQGWFRPEEHFAPHGERMARYLLRRRRPRSRKLCAVISVVVGCAILALNLCWPYLLRWLTERCGRPGKFCASSTTTTATPNNPALGWDSAPDPGSIPLLVRCVQISRPRAEWRMHVQGDVVLWGEDILRAAGKGMPSSLTRISSHRALSLSSRLVSTSHTLFSSRTRTPLCLLSHFARTCALCRPPSPCGCIPPFRRASAATRKATIAARGALSKVCVCVCV